VGKGEEAAPDALDLGGILVLQDRRQVVPDQPDDLGPVLAVVPVVDQADEAVIRPRRSGMSIAIASTVWMRIASRET